MRAQRLFGFAVVGALHALIGLALLQGLARKVIERAKQPLVVADAVTGEAPGAATVGGADPR
jgi:hypothetical protein